MKKYSRFQIIAEDKIGITLKILEKIYIENINLISLEVFPNKLYIKIEKIDSDIKLNLIKSIEKLPEIKKIEEIELLNHEENEKRLLAIIDAVDDGILAVDKNYKIELFNRYCESVFHYKKENVEGKDFRKYITSNEKLLNLLKSGREYTNVKLSSENENGINEYIATGRAIKDDDDNVVGAVCSIRNMKNAIEMANIVSNTKDDAFKEIVGSSKVIEKTKSIVELISKGNSTVLIRGESGTGKELFAKAIHNLSNRSKKPFIVVNCAAFPENLIESELFGYEKGSFTGALNNGKEGLIQKANGGTLFLDEIGEISQMLQVKLLRFLQEGKIRKIGGCDEKLVDVRIICATNRNLEEMIKTNEFREDLYYRLNVIPLIIPPLRERKEDIPQMVQYFISKFNTKLDKNICSIENEFINELLKYDWPGNIRELKNVIERAMNLCGKDSLSTEYLMWDYEFKNHSFEVNFQGDEIKLKKVVEIAEKSAIIDALKNHNSIRATAKALGVTHTTIINKIKKYNIKWQEKIPL